MAPDTGTPDAARSSPPGDAGPFAGTCDEADAVGVIQCPDVECESGPSWYWNGHSCFPIACGACAGPDCASGARTREACEATHSPCEAAICRETGGDWLWWVTECTHYRCGYPGPGDCERGRPVCDCGPSRSFVPRRGCVDDPSCPIPVPVAREELCRESRGSWDAVCCDSDCGIPCAARCGAMACDCGVGRIFDEVRGCVESSRCRVHRLGETCDRPGRCEIGTICCEHCPDGCSGSPTCVPPMCDDDPTRDACGNPFVGP